MSVEQLNYVLALGTIGLQILTIAFLALFLLRKKIPDLQGIALTLNTWGLWIAFLITIAGTALTLYYSEVLGFIPCGLCWFQRIFLYPQVALLAIAIYKKERSIADYSIVLSIFGFFIALYQHYLQMGGTAVIACPASGASDCAQRFLFEFGYITFPLMAVTLFAFLIVLMLFVRGKK